MNLNTTVIEPPWPGRPFHLACPELTTHEQCRQLSISGKIDAMTRKSPLGMCTEPEVQVAEAISSLLLGCDGAGAGCLYVDVGCNIGFFAAHAAALGAHVECFEPTPFYADAVRATVTLNKGFAERVRVVTAALVPGRPFSDHSSGLRFSTAFAPCGVGSKAQQRAQSWHAPTLRMDEMLDSVSKSSAGQRRRIDLLKIDIDSIEGALFHTAVEWLLSVSNADIRSIIIEYGDDALGHAMCEYNYTHHGFDARLKWGCRGYADGRPSLTSMSKSGPKVQHTLMCACVCMLSVRGCVHGGACMVAFLHMCMRCRCVGHAREMRWTCTDCSTTSTTRSIA